MKIPEIKKLVEANSIEELKKAEDAIINESQPEIQVGGDDEGEQLTHCLAAIWVKEEMEKSGDEFRVVLRRYTERVRNSIS